ncbi:MAG: ATP-binding protein [Bacteroidales bacterium]|nr:ATP-binding protein [Bacteroidales bacterium]
MKRKIYNELLFWKQRRKGKVALMIDGARRVGKSYIAEEFARNEYKSYILVDFNKADKPLMTIFDEYLTNLDLFFMHLSVYFGVRLYERDSLIIFDEVQLYPRARAAIKYLVADGRYDYLETGSLVSINRNVKDIVIPSEEHRISMFPMDFEEFLWAAGDDMTMPFVRECFEKRNPLGPLHRKVMDMFRQYMIVGGMPQAVQAFFENRSFEDADIAKREILSLYRADIEKYAVGYESKVKGIFDQIPAELQRHEKRFRLSHISDTARFRDYESSFFWLSDARIVNVCYAATEPSVGLKMRMDSFTLKCYMADTGLLISHAFDENTITNEKLYQKLLLDKLEINKGMLVENIVAQMLCASGHKLYFYSSYSKTDAEERMEIDFLVRKPVITNRHNICPIEVKSTTKYTIASLEKFCRKYNEQLFTALVLHSADRKEKDGIVYLPLYMAALL